MANDVLSAADLHFNYDDPAVRKYEFDADWYAKNNPDIGAGVDPLTHYLVWGRDQGRPANGWGGGVAPVAQPGNAPVFDPTSAASWGNYRQQAANATAGINRMPNVLGDTASIPMDQGAAQRQFYPQRALVDAQNMFGGLLGGGAAAQQPAVNLGWGMQGGGGSYQDYISSQQ